MDKVPEAVSVVARLRAVPTNRILIQNRLESRMNDKDALAVCVKPLHYYYNRVRMMSKSMMDVLCLYLQVENILLFFVICILCFSLSVFILMFIISFASLLKTLHFVCVYVCIYVYMYICRCIAAFVYNNNRIINQFYSLCCETLN